MRALPKELTFFAIMMKAPRSPMLLARADEGDRIKVPLSRAEVRRRKVAVARGFQLLS
jgi:hypothetical protein